MIWISYHWHWTQLSWRLVGEMLVYCGGQCPLSNFHIFHISDFDVDGVTYNCNEKFYVKKEEFTKDYCSSNESKDPQECKRISENLNKKHRHESMDGYNG